jgi:hypothetical protein
MKKSPSPLWSLWETRIRPALRFEHVYQDIPGIKQKGKEWRAPCPLHGGKNEGSLSICVEQGEKYLGWKCHAANCGKGGFPIEWLKERNGLTDEEAVRELGRRVGVELIEEKPRASREHLDEEALAEAWTSWRSRRRLAKDLLQQWDGFLLAWSKRPAMCFPTPGGGERIRFLDEGKPKTLWRKGDEPCWYGLEQALALLGKQKGAGRRLYLVNGEPSVWAAQQSGVPAVCTCAGEGALPRPALIRSLAAQLSDMETTMVVVFDLDEAGRRGTKKAVAALEAEDLHAIPLSLPADLGEKGDVDDLHRKVGDEHLAGALRKLKEQIELGPEHLISWIPDSPLPERCVVPDGYRALRDGLYTAGGKKQDRLEIFCRAPIAVSGRLRDLSTNEEWLELCWRQDRKWFKHIVPRIVAASAKRIVELAAIGCPVTSENSKAVVQWLDRWEAMNRDALPITHVSSRMGWQGDGGELGFLLGRHSIGGNTRFQAPAAEVQVADAWMPKGNMGEWLRAVDAIRGAPRVILGLYASFAAPLLEILSAPSFIIDWSGETSIGKTALLRVAASVWGCPNKGARDAVLGSWSSTKVYLERMLGTCNNLPLFLDDTKEVKRHEDVAQVLYMVANGRGRGRGTTTGVAATSYWSTILLSNGEQPATSFTEDGGTRARVLTIWGSPWGKTNVEMGKTINATLAALGGNYGHAGRQWVEWLCANRALWPSWQEMYRDAEEFYVGSTSGTVQARISSYLATIQVASVLVHEALPLPFPRVDVVDAVREYIYIESGGADRAKAAAEYTMAWFWSHQADFLNGPGRVDRIPNGGWAGVWRQKDREIQFFQTVISAVLKAGGFDEASTLRTWRDRGWIRADDGRYTCCGTAEGKRVRVVCMMPAKVDADLFEEENPGPRTEREPDGIYAPDEFFN